MVYFFYPRVYCTDNTELIFYIWLNKQVNKLFLYSNLHKKDYFSSNMNFTQMTGC